MTAAVDRFDAWMRREFVALNTELEEAYFAARKEIVFEPPVEGMKRTILEDGGSLIARVAEGCHTWAGPEQRYDLLGSVGFYLAACRRHEIGLHDGDNRGPLAAAWSLANVLGASLGVAPRYVFAHQSTHNPAVHGTYRTFTSLKDERTFITKNALAVLAYQRAADALRSVVPMGVSSPMAAYQFEVAVSALNDVLRFNRQLSQTLDVDRFFFNIRPYFKPYRVGAVEYRGTNAGDFAAINEIDLLLGLSNARDPVYQHVLTEKYAYVPPEDQVRLRAAVRAQSLLARFLDEAAQAATPQLRLNAELFLQTCRSHGAAYAFHHHKLVKPFLEEPAKTAPADRLDDLTASGPPLGAVIEGLAYLRDLRAARDRPGINSAKASLERLRELLSIDS